MKFMRLAACAVAFAVVGGMAVAEDMDIKALQAKLAAQEARLNDLQAKMGSGAAEAPASIISMRKNAKVTIGGDLDFRYIFDTYEYTGNFDDDGNPEVSKGSLNKADAFVDTADLRVGVEVNEHFDAFMRIGSHDNNKNTGVMRDAWIRWKNICNSGWGVLVGRDGLKFGMGKPIGMFDAWIQDSNSRSGAIPTHINYGVSRVTQINPYWESQDGKFRFDLSVFQTIESRNAESGYAIQSSEFDAASKGPDGDIRTANYGLGSGTIKLTWKPTEDWTIVGAVANVYADYKDDWYGGKARTQSTGGADYTGTAWNDAGKSNSNTAFHLGFIWNPAVFCKKLNLWAQATQEYNTAFVKDQDFFGTNFGLSYAFTDKFTAFAQGDYVNGEDANHDVDGWRSWVGMTYNMANGVMLEAGWTHEQIDHDMKVTGALDERTKGDTLYTRMTFAF